MSSSRIIIIGGGGTAANAANNIVNSLGMQAEEDPLSNAEKASTASQIAAIRAQCDLIEAELAKT